MVVYGLIDTYSMPDVQRLAAAADVLRFTVVSVASDGRSYAFDDPAGIRAVVTMDIRATSGYACTCPDAELACGHILAAQYLSGSWRVGCRREAVVPASQA